MSTEEINGRGLCAAHSDRTPWKIPSEEPCIHEICGQLPSEGFCCSLGDTYDMKTKKEDKSITTAPKCQDHFKLHEDIHKLHCM